MFKNIPILIEGGSHVDGRGKVSFINQFDMSLVKRIYYTEHFSKSIVRAWQAHKIEKRWFLCTQGTFKVKLVKIDDFENPSEKLKVYEYNLSSDKPEVLYVPNGFANGFKAEENNSKLMIFADYAMGVNEKDQFKFDKNKWTIWSKN